MKLRNKKTGEIHEITQAVSLSDDMNKKFAIYSQSEGNNYAYRTLAELNEEWEDAPEEPKVYWRIDCDGTISRGKDDFDTPFDNACKEIGNYFETEEEAEKAVEKLKAWKRLKDTYHISFNLDFVKNTISFTYRIDGTLHSVMDDDPIVFEDMKTIFGGEE